MKKSETTEEEWEDAIIEIYNKELLDWIKMLTEDNHRDIRIISTPKTTIIFDSCCEFYVIEVDKDGETLDDAVNCKLITEDVAKIISDSYISRKTNK